MVEMVPSMVVVDVKVCRVLFLLSSTMVLVLGISEIDRKLKVFLALSILGIHVIHG
jgi:hypothetical protein